jgi:WD40 repeat protein
MLLLKGHGSGRPVYSVAFAPDGMRLAAAGRKGKIVLWDIDF